MWRLAVRFRNSSPSFRSFLPRRGDSASLDNSNDRAINPPISINRYILLSRSGPASLRARRATVIRGGRRAAGWRVSAASPSLEHARRLSAAALVRGAVRDGSASGVPRGAAPDGRAAVSLALAATATWLLALDPQAQGITSDAP